jgi:hypothetical protein
MSLNVVAQAKQLALDGAGNLLVNVVTPVLQGAAPWITQPTASGAVGTPAPGAALNVAGVNGPNLQSFSVDPSGKLALTEMGGLADIMIQVLLEIRAMRAVLTTLLCESGKYNPEDFQPGAQQDLTTSETTTP